MSLEKSGSISPRFIKLAIRGPSRILSKLLPCFRYHSLSRSEAWYQIDQFPSPF